MNSYRVTDYYKTKSMGKAALWRQFKPDEREKHILPYEVTDPLNELKHMVSPRLIHRYKDRVLLLVTDNCLLYCRHCFRRDFIDRGENDITDNEVDLACLYIKQHPEVHEVLLSGGDPLTLDVKRLRGILNKIKLCRKNIIIRIGTRVPIVDPKMVTDDLIDVLKENSPIWMALQVNHPDELTEEAGEVLEKLSYAGVTLLNQSVLLKDVNDSVDILRDLSFKLLENRVKPYYLFQGDLAEGTSHLRVPLKKGLELMGLLRDEVSGIALPTYAVDIPGGGGKVPLNSDYIIDEDEKYYYLKNSSGFVGQYPKE